MLLAAGQLVAVSAAILVGLGLGRLPLHPGLATAATAVAVLPLADALAWACASITMLVGHPAQRLRKS